MISEEDVYKVECAVSMSYSRAYKLFKEGSCCVEQTDEVKRFRYIIETLLELKKSAKHILRNHRALRTNSRTPEIDIKSNLDDNITQAVKVISELNKEYLNTFKEPNRRMVGEVNEVIEDLKKLL